MHDYNEINHQLSIYPVRPSVQCSVITKAPAIMLDSSKFEFRATYSKTNGHSAAEDAEALARYSSLSYPSQPPKIAPTEFLLINCAFGSEIYDIDRPFDEYGEIWKLYHVSIKSTRRALRFAHIPSFNQNSRVIAILEFSSAFLKMDCHIRHDTDKRRRQESYRCRFNIYETPSDHAPIEIGIRSRSTQRNCVYSIRDYLV